MLNFKVVLIVLLSMLTMACGPSQTEVELACIKSPTCQLDMNRQQPVYNQGINQDFEDYEDYEYEDQSSFAGAAVGGVGAYGAYKIYKGRKYVKTNKGKWITEQEAQRRKTQSNRAKGLTGDPKHDKKMLKQQAKHDKKLNKQNAKHQKKVDKAARKAEKKRQKAERKAQKKRQAQQRKQQKNKNR